MQVNQVFANFAGCTGNWQLQQSAAASRELTNQADTLNEMVRLDSARLKKSDRNIKDVLVPGAGETVRIQKKPLNKEIYFGDMNFGK